MPSLIVLGTDTMSSKPTHRKIKNDNQIHRPAVKLDIARKTSSSCASSNDTRCPMVLVIYLGTDDFYYLSKKSNLTHAFHPKLKADAIQRGQRDLSSGDIDLISLLFDISATPLQISTSLGCLKGNDAGCYLPKRIYGMNKKTKIYRTLLLDCYPIVLMQKRL